MSNQRRKITLATVGAAVGVSGATVSNAFHRPDQLSTELRERILATAAEMGYQGPDPVARALSKGWTGLVGLLLSESLTFALSDPAAVLMLQGLGAACDIADVGLVLLPVTPGSPTALHARAGVDGYVVYSMPDDDPSVAALLSGGRPMVTVDQPRIDGVGFVGVDDREVARRQLGRLLDLGHRDIGVLAYRLTPSRGTRAPSLTQQARSPYLTTRLRRAGYLDALAAFELPPSTVTFQASPTNDVLGGGRAATRLLQRRPEVTALLTDGDQLAIGAMHAAVRAGRRIPDDLSIISADDTPAAQLTTPALSAVTQPFATKGRTAGEQLFKLLGNDDVTPIHTVLPVGFAARGTTTRPGQMPHTSL